MTLRIGIDLGGTKTELIVLDSDGNERYRERQATPSHDYQAIIDQLQHMVLAAEQTCGEQASVGIGTPGALDHQGLIKNSNTQVINGRPFDEDLSQALKREIRIANDANCFALSEAIDGAGTGAQTVFGVIIGTGTGGGIVINGQVLSGANNIAGEWGHNPLPWPQAGEGLDGPRCYCGKHSCIETFLSGPGMEKAFQQLTSQSVSSETIVDYAHQGNRHAKHILANYCDRLARSLAQVINILDPNVIVLGGGLSNIKEIYQVVPQLWGDYIFSNHITTQLLPATHGDSSGVRGAAWLWPNK